MTIDLIAQLVLAGFGLYQSIKAKNYRQAADTLIDSIETVSAKKQEASAVKAEVKTKSILDGTSPTIAARVKAVTRNRKR